MIIEAIITTMDAAGLVNFAPMGVEWGDDRIVVKPFLETTTFRNLRDGGAAVVNLTDDVMLFARAAISSPQYPAFPAVRVRGVVLEAACSWRELEVRHIDATPPRSRIDTAVVHHGAIREFIGFNRARNAVLETAIVATRTHLDLRGRDSRGCRTAAGDRRQDGGPARAGSDGPPHRSHREQAGRDRCDARRW